MPLIIISGLILGGYLLALRGAQFLLNQGEVGRLLLDRVFYLGWSIIFYLLIISNIITAFSTLYRSPEVNFLLTHPIAYGDIFKTKLLENLLYSSWVILVLGIPLTGAYLQANGLFNGGWIWLFPVGLIPYLLLATMTGLVIILVIIRLSKWIRLRILFLALGAIVWLFFWLYFRYNQQTVILTGETASFRVMSRYLFNLTRDPFPLIPSYWFTELLHKAGPQRLFSGSLLVTTALVGWELTRWLGRGMYYPTVQILNSHRRQPATRSVKPGFLTKLLGGLQPPVRGLVFKDVLQFVRTPQQWIQFLLFGFFIGIYLLNLARVNIQMQALAPFWRILIYILNFGFSGFVIAALTARFVFPLISLEGKGLWILMAAPVKLRSLFMEKFWLSAGLFFALAETVALVSNYFLGQGLRINLLATAFLILLTFGLVSISLGLGALFPQFHERNPMRIASGTGGTITILFSLAYLVTMVAAFIWFLLLMEKQASIETFFLVGLGVLIFNGIVIYIPLNLGLRQLVNTEL
jgi:ABC-2 type transport system permease protein